MSDFLRSVVQETRGGRKSERGRERGALSYSCDASVCLFFCDVNVFMICLCGPCLLSFSSDAIMYMFFVCVLCVCECFCAMWMCM